jgi:hypothetical protein
MMSIGRWPLEMVGEALLGLVLDWGWYFVVVGLG